MQGSRVSLLCSWQEGGGVRSRKEPLVSDTAVLLGLRTYSPLDDNKLALQYIILKLCSVERVWENHSA